MEAEINTDNIKEIPLDNWYLEKTNNDFEAEMIAHYGEKFDSLGWTPIDSKMYHMVKIKGRGLTGYGNTNMIQHCNCTKLSFDEFFKLAFDSENVKPKVEKQSVNQSPLNIETIHKVLLKYIGEEEADDIIKELKQLK